MNLRLTKTFGIGPKVKSASGLRAKVDPAVVAGWWRSRRPALRRWRRRSSSCNSDRRYNLILGVNARNVFNNVNVANPNARSRLPVL